MAEATEVVEQTETQDSTTTETTETPETTKRTDSSTQVTAPAKKAEDDRTRGILADLQKERKERQRFEQEFNTTKTQLEAEKRRVAALAGVNPRTPEEADHELVRARFKQLFPELAELTKEDIEALRDYRSKAAGLEEATTFHWRKHSRQMLDSVSEQVAAQIGGKLSERQVIKLERAYANEAANNPEFLARHEAGDPKLVAEFVTEWIDDWFEPARRKVTAVEVDRARRVPSGRDRSIAGPGGKPLDYNNPKAFEDALVASFKKHGGEFGE